MEDNTKVEGTPIKPEPTIISPEVANMATPTTPVEQLAPLSPPSAPLAPPVAQPTDNVPSANQDAEDDEFSIGDDYSTEGGQNEKFGPGVHLVTVIGSRLGKSSKKNTPFIAVTLLNAENVRHEETYYLSDKAKGRTIGNLNDFCRFAGKQADLDLANKERRIKKYTDIIDIAIGSQVKVLVIGKEEMYNNVIDVKTSIKSLTYATANNLVYDPAIHYVKYSGGVQLAGMPASMPAGLPGSLPGGGSPYDTGASMPASNPLNTVGTPDNLPF